MAGSGTIKAHPRGRHFHVRSITNSLDPLFKIDDVFSNRDYLEPLGPHTQKIKISFKQQVKAKTHTYKTRVRQRENTVCYY